MLGRVLFVVIAVVTFAADRFTKLLVVDRLALGERRELVGELLQLHHIHNRGIAFGLFSDAGVVVVLGSVVVAVLLFVFMLQIAPDDRLTLVGGALITGGAMGNLVDRVQQGYVVDFLRLPNWPMFNVADVGITSGVVLVLLGQLRAARRASSEEQQA